MDNEISETALIAIENLILKCQNEARQTLKSLFQLTGKCLVYDPNYTYHDDDDGADQDMDEGGEDWGSDFYDDEQDDDDDTAWKVRKSSIKIIDAIIISCPVELKEYWAKYVELLSSRFNERDDNVKCNILETFQNLMKASVKIDESFYSDSSSMRMVKQRSYVE
jgi:cullin-associated NEDD8-dissociated protein 1